MPKILRALLPLLLGGCFAPDFQSGHLECGGSGDCPPGFHCAVNRCYRDGEEPDMSVATMDLRESQDATPADLTPVDLEPADLVTPPDLTPVIILTPPAAAWTSAGGGSPKALSGSQLNLSFGGSIAKGTSSALSGATVTFGYFSSDTY
jgi:hypothetical protein